MPVNLLLASKLTRIDVDDGSTVTDFLPAERARGITIQSAAITFHWPPLPPDQNQSKSPTASKSPANAIPRSLASHTINLIDTPGHADFTFEVLRSLRILDGAVCILDGVAGVEAQTEKVWNQANYYQIPRIIFVNKLDRDGAAFARTVKEIGSRLQSWPALCQIPWWEGGNGRFTGVGDVVGLRGMKWEEGSDGKAVKAFTLEELRTTDAQLAEEISKARVALVELLSEHDDEMVERFLEHDEDHLAIPAMDITESLRRCLVNGPQKIVPVFAGASFRNIGVQPLLDAVVDLLPDPTERPDPEVRVGALTGGLNDLISGKLLFEQSRPEKSSRKKNLVPTSGQVKSLVKNLESCALAFKVVNDPRRGVLVYVRVYSGSINRNTLLFNTNLHVSERAQRLLKMYANDAIEVPSIGAGQIGVIPGLKHARTGDTLISFTGASTKSGPPAPLNTLQLRPIDVPPPVFFASVEPHSLSEEKHVSESLALLLREDPSLSVSMDEDSGQTHLSGMGELHLEIANDRLVNDFKAKASMGSIEIGYRECILASSAPETRIYDKEIAGKKGTAGATALVEPLSPEDVEAAPVSPTNDSTMTIQRDGNLITISHPDLDASTSPVPLQTIHTSLTNGALAALARGPKHAFPLHSTHVRLTLDPASHLFGADTTPAALSSAARLATSAALKASADDAGTALMQPVMNVVINVDEASLGAVVHDISSARGGHVLSLGDDSSSSSSSSSGPPAEDSPAIPTSKIYAPPDPFASFSNNESDYVSGSRGRSIVARVPLKEMVGYLKHLRSLTGGRGTFVMSVDRFERLSAQAEKKVVAEMRGMFV
ncbi:MAG: Ribosome-releasing factor 2, mitochondrial [Sarea resinae]|nr:MAG: Ribosome-releasing factor 2, mitochondrial [Sarea resinae]